MTDVRFATGTEGTEFVNGGQGYPRPFVRVTGDAEAFAASARAGPAVDPVVERDVTAS